MAMTWTNHPSVVMVNDNEPRLRVLKYLQKDPSLPKHLVNGKVMLKGKKPMSVDEYMKSPDGMSSYRRHSTGSMDLCSNKKKSFFAKVKEWLIGKTRIVSTPPATFDDAKSLLKGNVISSDIEKATIKLRSIIDKTRANGQVALVNRLENEYANLLNEVVLFKNGLFNYLTEEDVINLFKTADFGIRIDFWNDYPDFVPDEVMEAKKKADSLCVFDNWCVMHFDPDGSALRQIKVEEWRRDPILFGMIVGSDRLYYVKDWKTDKDDLTVEKVCGILHINRLRDSKDYGAISDYPNIIVAMNEPDVMDSITYDATNDM